ncbi:unnamed protein product [marine sediment metagenome]|uniref:Uncharacterized protein n=1 Tax=marine sediment metagenome TaxID=412755 RepID=X1JTS8_9ZZZZ
MKKILIFCPSYTSLLPALGIIEKNKMEDIVLIKIDKSKTLIQAKKTRLKFW